MTLNFFHCSKDGKKGGIKKQPLRKKKMSQLWLEHRTSRYRPVVELNALQSGALPAELLRLSYWTDPQISGARGRGREVGLAWGRLRVRGLLLLHLFPMRRIPMILHTTQLTTSTAS
jgi:hypothetical protein